MTNTDKSPVEIEMVERSKEKLTEINLNMEEKITNNNDDEQNKEPMSRPRRILNQIKDVFMIVLRVIGVLLCLYVFIVALELMSDGFRICLGLQIGQLFRSESIVTNPITSLIMGVLVTVMVQSSSASTSIVVSLVASKVIPLKNAIPIIMGANMGTTVTSALVSLTQVKYRENFGRAFSGATVHDAFNILSVLVLFPIELATGYLSAFSSKLVSAVGTDDNSTSSSGINFLNAIKEPVVHGIIQIDKTLLDKYSDPNYNITGNETFLKRICKKRYPNGTEYDANCKYILKSDLFDDWSENTIGIVLTIVSLIVVIVSLLMISKILGSIFKGAVAKVIQRIVNAKPEGVWNYVIGYFALLVGAGFTMLLQSSSVFTSSLIPLVANGIVSLERVFPLTLGSNIGTTFTGILAALGQSNNLKESLQISLVHTLFNITGILIWYPVPFMRRAPLTIAKYLGDRSYEHKWFAVGYLLFVFVFVPGLSLGLALISNILLYVVFGLVVFLVVLMVAFNLVRTRFPQVLPAKLRTWEFLPGPIKYIFCGLPSGSNKVTPTEDAPAPKERVANDYASFPDKTQLEELDV